MDRAHVVRRLLSTRNNEKVNSSPSEPNGCVMMRSWGYTKEASSAKSKSGLTLCDKQTYACVARYHQHIKGTCRRL